MCELGRIVATPNALATLARCGRTPAGFIARHVAGDWGDVPPEDAAEHQLSVGHGFCILSSYPIGAGRVWVITAADRSATALLRPSAC